MGKLRAPRPISLHRRPFYLSTSQRTRTTTRYAELEQELDHLIESSEAIEEAAEPEVIEEPCNEGQKQWEDSDFPELGADSTHIRDLKLGDGLVMCFGDYGVAREARDRILQLLREHGHPHLPTCSASLMKSSRTVKAFIQEVAGGEMYYSGIENGLRKTVTQDYLSACKEICLDIFWDGLSPYKSVNFKIWPILCRLSATDFSKESPPFIVAVFGGKKDPKPDVFLKDFIVEAKQLQKDGLIFNEIRYEVVFQKFIADYPARCKMKCVNGEGPSSFVQCERCTVKGKKRGPTTFTSSDVARQKPTLRTDKSVREKHQMAYHTHYLKGPRPDSPLMQLNIDMCFSLPIDPMHALYAGGVVKRWWEFLVESKRAVKYHITGVKVEKISKYMTRELRESFPSEYARRVRGVNQWKVWKATEWRRFLLYDGMLVIKTFFGKEVFRNFLLLSCAVRILSSPELIRKDGCLSDAHDLLELFVRDIETKFGKQFMAIKAHSLTHLAKECEKHGVLDSFSGFPFESYLSRINRAMTAHGRCVRQIVRRIKEGHLLQPTPVSMLSHGSSASLSMQVGPSEWLESEGIEYLQASLPGMVIRTDRRRDSVVKSFADEVIRVISIIHDTSEDKVFVIGYTYTSCDNFFHWPIKSRVIGIEKVWGLNSVKRKWPIQTIKCKCVLLKIKCDSDEWLCLPQVHEESHFRSLQRNMAH